MVAPQFRIAQRRAQHRHQRVVLALGHGAGVGLDLSRYRLAVGDGGLVGRVTHPGRAEFGQQRFEVGAKFRGGAQPGLGHPVRALAAQDEPTLAGPILLAERAVRIEFDGQPSASRAS